MKKKNQRKSAIMSTLILLLLTAVLLITSTFAWFTANQTVTVSSLDVSVVASNGLQISADATNWKAVLTNDDITGAHAVYTTSVNQIPKILTPVSSIGEVDTKTGHMKMFSGTVAADQTVGSANYGQYVITSDQQTDKEENGDSATGSYIAFDLFLKVDQATQIYLAGGNSNVTVQDGKTDLGLQNAARVAFINEGNAASGSDLATIRGLAAGTTATTAIWEPNYDVHTAAAVSNALDTYGITTTTTAGAKLAYSGIKAAIASDKAVDIKKTTAATDYFGAVTPTISTEKAYTKSQTLTNLNLAAGVTKVRLYMWVEGQDVDCDNTASGANIAFNVQFTKVAPV